jgi:hypothetical protein
VLSAPPWKDATLAVAPLRTELDANSSRLEEVRRAGERERERDGGGAQSGSA